MTAEAFHSYDDFIAELRRLGVERRTGTLFIVSPDNESGQIGLRDGAIVHIRFRRKTGIEAADLLRRMGTSQFSFTRDLVVATDPTLSSVAVLAALADVEMAPVAHHTPHPGLGSQEAVLHVLTEALTEYLGPVAAVVVRDQLREAERAGSEPAAVVETLARGIEEPAAASAFKRQAAAGLARIALERKSSRPSS
jgi:hypothetical protein